MPRIFLLNTFKSDYQKLTREQQRNCDDCLQQLFINPKHPSLRMKKMHGVGNIWEARVSGDHRITFTAESDCLYIRRVGSHDVLRKP
jgi:mRNA-degrading endonuclease YafQ of YafQ-DinJ toxin-antitoxin module